MAVAQVIGKGLVDTMAEDKELDEYARTALEFTSTVVSAQPGVYAVKDQLTASRLMLDFTKEKPTQKQDLTVHGAEQFLDELAAEESTNADNGGREEEGST